MVVSPPLVERRTWAHSRRSGDLCSDKGGDAAGSGACGSISTPSSMAPHPPSSSPAGTARANELLLKGINMEGGEIVDVVCLGFQRRKHLLQHLVHVAMEDHEQFLLTLRKLQWQRHGSATKHTMVKALRH